MCVPIKLLLPSKSALAEVKLPISLGMSPVNWLWDNEIAISSWHCHRLRGTGPVTWLLVMSNACRRGRCWHMSSGKLPVRVLFAKSMPIDEERLKIAEGIVPVKKLFDSDSTCSSARLPSSCEILPALE